MTLRNFDTMASQEERDRIMAEYLASVQQDEDEDEDDEAEFEPGDDEEDDNLDEGFAEDDDVDEDVVILKGSLQNVDGRLLYKGRSSEGDTFEVKSQPLHFSLDAPTATKPEEDTDPPGMRTIAFEGQFMFATKAKIDITLTRPKRKPTGKSLGDNDRKPPPPVNGEMDGKSPAKMDSKSPVKKSAPQTEVYGVFGKGPGFEFYGEANPHTMHESSGLECQYRRTNRKAPPAAAAAAVSAAAVPADDDVENDVDEGVDYDELIALHQDAGMPVADLKKRYAAGAATKPPPAKRGKSADDSDEEYGF